jgi:hypothetical protein
MFIYQEHLTIEKHKKLISTGTDNTLGYPTLINCAVGLTTSKIPSINLLDKYISIIYHHQLLAADIKKKITPLYGLTFTSFTDDVGVVDMKTRTRMINAGHMNAYLIIPGIIPP